MRFLHFTRTLNVGDESCCPLRYFADMFPNSHENHLRTAQYGEVAVIGGGGVINAEFTPFMQRLGPSILWGSGSNYHGRKDLVYPECLDGWPLVGIRDVGSKYRWVPCVSCMSSCFNTTIEPSIEVCTYMHREVQVKDAVGPTMTNHGDVASLHISISFLAKARLVRTNSYHGAYWALLLGREVELLEPFSNRFFYLPGQYEGNRIHPKAGMLDECRKANIDFANDVLSYLKKKGLQ